MVRFALPETISSGSSHEMPQCMAALESRLRPIQELGVVIRCYAEYLRPRVLDLILLVHMQSG